MEYKIKSCYHHTNTTIIAGPQEEIFWSAEKDAAALFLVLVSVVPSATYTEFHRMMDEYQRNPTGTALRLRNLLEER